MDKVLLLITLVAEAMTVLQCMQIVFMQKMKFDKVAVGFVFVDVVIYLLINMGVIPFVGVIVVYLFAGVLCYFKFRKRLIETVIRVMVGFTLIAGIECMATYVVNYFKHADNMIHIATLGSIIGLVFTYMLQWICFVFSKRVRRKGDFWKQGVLLLYGLWIVRLFMEYYFKQKEIKIYVVVASIFIVCIFFIIHRLERAQNEIEKKNYELEMQKIYGETYESLLGEVRKRQHDYKNQLAAIYGMHMTARTLDELVSMQKGYGEELRENHKFDSILTCCSNPILAGFIYYRCVSCEKEGIAVDYDIHIEQAECRFALHEIIEILGILIDNACECVKMDHSLEQGIGLEFREDTEKIEFLVFNPSNYISFSEIDKMFLSGYSSKGNGRGIGLARVRELVNQYKAEIKVFNTAPAHEGNRICFCLRIEK